MLHLAGPVLLFGGCYSNLQATEALLNEAARRGIPPGNMICTGDIIAYGADAAATLRLVRGTGIPSIKGNCEAALSLGAEDCGCGFAPGSACDELAAHWYAHALRQVDEEDRRYMAALPERLDFMLGGKRFSVVHGNAERVNAFVFPSAGNLEFLRQIELADADGVIAGHCGIPFERRIGRKIWHNAGSIGLPANDGTRRGWFSILELAGGEIQITRHALDYDYQAAAAAMRRAGLPEGYARALETGLWPSLDILPAAETLRTGMALESSFDDEPAPVVKLQKLQTLWVNTGTLCNLACTLCFMESSPVNDALAYFPLAAFLELLAGAPEEIGFTGGEPFMNQDFLAMLEATLASGRQALVLTNAMRPMMRVAEGLSRLIAAYPGKLAVRVSVDHYGAAKHDALRGEGSFATTLAGLKFLAAGGAKISVAARMPWGESETMMRDGFAKLFAAHGIAAELVLFPEMDVESPVPAVTERALAAVPAEKPLMCRTSRMVVQRKGATGVSFTPCTLLPDRVLERVMDDVALDHPHCGQFCVFGGASCA